MQQTVNKKAILQLQLVYCIGIFRCFVFSLYLIALRNIFGLVDLTFEDTSFQSEQEQQNLKRKIFVPTLISVKNENYVQSIICFFYFDSKFEITYPKCEIFFVVVVVFASNENFYILLIIIETSIKRFHFYSWLKLFLTL